MSNIQVIVDSTGAIPKEYVQQNPVEVVPLTVLFEGKEFKEGFPGEFDDFYNALKTSASFPSTSQPSVQSFAAAFEKAISQGKEVIAITMSSKLSGTYNSAYTASQMTNPDLISIIDSETTGPNLRAMAEHIVELAKENKSRQEIIEIISQERRGVGVFFTVDTLDYLKKGGRLSNMQAIIGNILNIKPIISLTDGILINVEKVRGKHKAIDYCLDQIPDNVKKISVVQIQNIEEATMVKEQLEAKYPNARIIIEELGPVIGSHLGPKCIGVCFMY